MTENLQTQESTVPKLDSDNKDFPLLRGVLDSLKISTKMSEN